MLRHLCLAALLGSLAIVLPAVTVESAAYGKPGAHRGASPNPGTKLRTRTRGSLRSPGSGATKAELKANGFKRVERVSKEMAYRWASFHMVGGRGYTTAGSQGYKVADYVVYSHSKTGRLQLVDAKTKRAVDSGHPIAQSSIAIKGEVNGSASRPGRDGRRRFGSWGPKPAEMTVAIDSLVRASDGTIALKVKIKGRITDPHNRVSRTRGVDEILVLEHARSEGTGQVYALRKLPREFRLESGTAAFLQRYRVLDRHLEKAREPVLELRLDGAGKLERVHFKKLQVQDILLDGVFDADRG